VKLKMGRANEILEAIAKLSESITGITGRLEKLESASAPPDAEVDEPEPVVNDDNPKGDTPEVTEEEPKIEDKTPPKELDKEKKEILATLKEILSEKHGVKDFTGVETIEDARKVRAFLEKNKVGLKSLDEMNEKVKPAGEKREPTKWGPDLTELKRAIRG